MWISGFQEQSLERGEINGENRKEGDSMTDDEGLQASIGLAICLGKEFLLQSRIRLQVRRAKWLRICIFPVVRPKERLDLLRVGEEQSDGTIGPFQDFEGGTRLLPLLSMQSCSSADPNRPNTHRIPRKKHTQDHQITIIGVSYTVGSCQCGRVDDILFQCSHSTNYMR